MKPIALARAARHPAPEATCPRKPLHSAVLTCVVMTLAAVLLSACAAHAPLSGPGSGPAPQNTEAVSQISQTSQVPQVMVDDPPLTLHPRLDGTALMQEPRLDAPRLELLPASGRLIRFRTEGCWARVLDPASGRIGWVENKLLTPQAPAQPSTKPGQGTISETF